jgi:serine/threonine-protein kinase
VPFRSGENVGPYRIIEQLGQGGMATVFKAYHPALDRHVAIKAMHPAFMQDPQFLARFEREARVVASLDHPNIVPIYDFAQQGGQPYLVMKFVEGQTLKAVLDSRSLTHAVKSVGAALSYAHQRGVLHRDIKPSNILLTAEGQVYLADFGLARIAEAGQSSLSGDQLLGTPHYISPEQARGERDLDQGTDIYSLGIVLYQLTVGRVPFNADTPFSIIHDHIYTPLPMPRESHPEMSESLENVLLKALAKDRRDRFATVDDLVRAFEAAFTGKTVRPPAQVTTVAAGGASRGEVAKPRPSAVGAEADEASGPAPAPGLRPGAAATRAPARRRWPWVLGGLGLSSLCLLTFAVAASQELRTKPTTPTEAASPGPALVTPAPADLPAKPDAVQAAQAAVDGRPEDPQARLELAKTLEASGQLPQAYLEFMKAGELFLQQGIFTRAADSLLGAARLQQQRGTQDPRLAELLTQTLFLGAPTGEMLPWVQSAAELSPGIPGLDALEARARLFMGERDRAKQLLEGILAARPEDLLAGAVMVDLLQAEGNTPEAVAQADRILARPRLPEWLTKHLNGLKASMIAP